MSGKTEAPSWKLSPLHSLLTTLALLTVAVAAVALGYARWEYRRRGKLSIIGMLLLCAMLLMPNLMLHYAASYEWPTAPLDYLGVFIAAVGIVICAAGFGAFRSPGKVLCLEAPSLTATGVYRWSRNPQYVGWLLFLLGFVLNEWSLWALLALVLVAISLHLLVLVEEEHLRFRLGDEFTEFCQKTPRYIGA